MQFLGRSRRAFASAKRLDCASLRDLDRHWLLPAPACRHASTTEAPARVLFQTSESVRPGDTVQLSFASRADIAVSVGDHEAVDIQVSVPQEASAAALAVELTKIKNMIEYSTLALIEKGQASPTEYSVQVRAPARFVSLEICTAGGSVFVESMKEASLSIESQGGSISVPSIKGDRALLRSAGGTIRGSVTAAKADICSGGGAVQVKSLVGTSVVLDSQGGPVTLGACYADQAALRSGGGSVSLGTLRCQEAAVESGGGAISVDSVQGSAQLSSAGGDILVHVQPDVQRLSMCSSGGAITLDLSHGTAGTLLFPGGAQVSLPGGLPLGPPPAGPGPQQVPDMVAMQLLPQTDDNGSNDRSGVGGGLRAGSPGSAPLSRLQAAQAAGRGNRSASLSVIEVQPGAGQVLVMQSSWMEAMQRKFQAGRK